MAYFILFLLHPIYSLTNAEGREAAERHALDRSKCEKKEAQIGMIGFAQALETQKISFRNEANFRPQKEKQIDRVNLAAKAK